MKRITFDEFLREKHAENYHGFDDDMPDAFDAWVGELEVEDVIDYAEEMVASIPI